MSQYTPPPPGSPRWGNVTLRSRESQAPPPQVSKKGEEPKAEFQGFRLRRTLREKDREEKRKGGPAESKYDFGVKLKVCDLVSQWVCCYSGWTPYMGKSESGVFVS